ncbi:hypothetical protein B0919_15745 [Hymenobacter sp. CRA2]|nr:hypothetical protein B0919_15745 [Hymenobacter sp. CRA2]
MAVTSVNTGNYATGVDTTLREIRLTFNQDMVKGFSMVEHSVLPRLTGKPGWVDARTFSLPVRLAPNQLYYFTLNNPYYKRVRSAAGEVLPHYPIVFETQKPALTPEEQLRNRVLNTASYELFCQKFLKEYSHLGKTGINWRQVLADHRTQLTEAPDASAFLIQLLRVLQPAHDLHLRLRLNGQGYPTYERLYELNSNDELRPKLVQNFRQWSKYVSTGELGPAGYLAIDSWDRNHRDEIRKCLDALQTLREKPYLIIDVRQNGGGDESIAQEMAAQFFRRKTVYSRIEALDEKKRTITRVEHNYVQPAGKNPYAGKVFVLTGAGTMSSSEAFVLMMQQQPNTTLVGAPTCGSSGNPKPVELPNGVRVLLPSWREMDRWGHPIEGHGVQPDVHVAAREEEFASADPVLQRALELIKEPVAITR